MTPVWTPPEKEIVIGLGFYHSETPGAEGSLKVTPGDFRVDEVSAYPRPDPEGRFTVLRVESEGWEQHELAAALARRLNLDRYAVQWAGTKDRRAVSERLFSYVGTPPAGELDLPRTRLLETYRAREGLRLGYHFGNRFQITLKNLVETAATSESRYRATAQALREAGGVPNFFGPQRFGEVRPITHEVGRAVVRGDLDGAVEIYLAAVPTTDERPADPARLAYGRDHDPVTALRDFPAEYRFERTLLEHLARGHSAERAFRALGRELRLLFVHAYQSLLFNRWLTERRRRGIGLREVVVGDRVLRRGRDGTMRGDEAVPVDADNLPECSRLVSRDQATVAGPLVGFETPLPPGPAGEVLATLLAQEQLDPAAFQLPRTPELASRGSWRPALFAVPPLDILVEASVSESGSTARFQFSLPRGAYATVLLREFTKSGATRA